ncbi:hypothetical protein BDR22DRAFT_872491 [Usnea florida]
MASPLTRLPAPPTLRRNPDAGIIVFGIVFGASIGVLCGQGYIAWSALATLPIGIAIGAALMERRYYD